MKTKEEVLYEVFNKPTERELLNLFFGIEPEELFDKMKTAMQEYAEQKEGIKDSVYKKAMWWISNGQVGLSSKTMWNCLMGNKEYGINHPHDPGDFGRCYKLLKAVPEWKTELHKLKTLSPAWNNLVDNWDKITFMYEENEKTYWKEYKRIGMYEFMQELIEKPVNNFNP